jgi:thiosulfate/3-mercaptopyruvate sulfurtransferase
MDREDLLIEAEELASLIGEPDLRLFDSTVLMQGDETARDKYDNGHIPGAVFLDHAAISDPDAKAMYMVPDEAVLAKALGDLGISNDTMVVAYSTGEICWATRIWWVLRYAGHRNVRVLNGGFGAWRGALETKPNQYEPATFSTSLSPDMFADKDEVMTAITDGGTCVVNALPEAIYTGDADIFYAGHITGSISNPMHDYMEGQYLLPDETLKAKFADKVTDERLITYCGGGIAATLNACVAVLVGAKNVAVYDGSMNEWLNEELPVTKGQEPGTLK